MGCSWRWVLGLWLVMGLAASVAGEVMPLRGAHGFADGHGWASNAMHLWVTSDAGAHWRDATPRSARQRIQRVYFSDANDGWLIAAERTAADMLNVLVTHDGGVTWTRLSSITPRDAGAYVDSMYMTTTGYAWLMLQLPSSSNFSLGRLLFSDDGGVNWRALPNPPSAGRLRFDSPTEGHLRADGGHQGDYVTHNGGVSWQRVTQNNLARQTHAKARAQVLLADDLNADEAVIDAQWRADGSGWVLVAGGSCKAFKTQCAQHTRLLAVDAGGVVTDISPQREGRLATPQLVVRSDGQKGFDKCAAASISQTNAWWHNTPWNWTNIYIGGSNRGCSQTNLTSAWVSAVLATGFTLVPTWVGPQAHGTVCAGCGLMSSNSSTAYQQGINQAHAATSAAAALGLHAPTIIYYDMERYDPSNNSAANAFISGWVKGLHDDGNQAGVYGSPGNISHYASLTNVPDAVWLASWNGSASVFGISGIADALWANHERLHQYQGGHNATYNGVTFNIDSNSSDGPVAGGDCQVDAPILAKYNAMGGIHGILGRCTTNTNPTANGGKYNHFVNGSIYASSATGTHEVHGAISDKWNALQWELGPLGYPTSDETSVGDGVGRYNRFEHGAIYWTAAVNAHALYGAIFSLWDTRGRTHSCLGYPTSDEYADGSFERNDFQRGKITWSSSQGAVADCSDRIFANDFEE